jgi:hypothetical protein
MFLGAFVSQSRSVSLSNLVLHLRLASRSKLTKNVVAELASAYPVAGAQYYWSFMVSSDKYKPFASFL